MVCSYFEVGKQQRFSGGMFASAMRFDGDKNGVNLGECFFVIGLHHPAFLRGVILVENTKLRCLVPVGSSLSPRFKRACVLDPGVLVQIVSIKDERLSFGEKDPSGGFPSVSVTRDVINFRNVQVSRTDEISDVAVFRK